MLSLGIMAARLSSEEKYFTEIALASEKDGCSVYRFCPDQINCRSKTILGEEYDYQSRQWTATEFSIPDFIYDRRFHGLTRQSETVSKKIHWLKNHVAFLGFGLPGKYAVFQSLREADRLSRFLPPVNKVIDTSDIWKELVSHRQVMLKPEYGSRGIGIYLVTSKGSGWVVRMTKSESGYERFFANIIELNNWFHYLLEQCPYVAQPYLELTNSDDEPYDVRILIQKESNNTWMERIRGARIGRKHCITANLAAGARVIPFDLLLRAFQPALQTKILESINNIIELIPGELETRFNRLFELGIDLGIDKKGDVWILDINSKPGRKIMELLDSENMHKLYKAPFLQCRFLNGALMKAGE